MTNIPTAWRDFTPGAWQKSPDVRTFIKLNYTPYCDEPDFLADVTSRTEDLNEKVAELCKKEQEHGGVLDIDNNTVSSLLTYGPGYVDKEKELIVGLQTDAPLKRGVNPFGGLRMARKACEAYGYELGEEIQKSFQYRTTHNNGVYRVYTDAMRSARRCGVITGLPDAYGRGRIIGDYRRVALYGIDQLINWKKADKEKLGKQPMTEAVIRRSEELWREIDFLDKLKQMAELYGYDISGPAESAQEAVQWVYFAYLGAIKEQNGAAMSLGRVSTFLDIYFERDLAEKRIDETRAQEIIDDCVLKLRLARQLRTPEYNELFAGDPTWVTEAVGGVTEEGQSLVTKNSFRFLHTLKTLGPGPEPNLTVLWAPELPASFREYCARISIDTDAIQYENDTLMRNTYGDDYGIACCVSAMKIGKQMQFFGARCNLPKVLLMALNGGRDEISGDQVGPEMPVIDDEVLDFDKVSERFAHYRGWLAELYANTMNVIHYMHDKYAYEKLQMALHDTEVERFMAFGIAGLSVVADSLSAIKHATVIPVKDERGLITDFDVSGDFPCYGNDAPAADQLAQSQVQEFMTELNKHKTYRDSIPTLSILTITSNVVYGHKTGATPDGRKHGDPFAPGANPMHDRDEMGALASLNSVAAIPYDCCRDGVSCTFTVTPTAIGAEDNTQVDNLAGILDGYFQQGGHHLNVNVLNREHLIDAMHNPEKYPHLTIRVSGYAVHFNRLSREQKEEVISRTFHGRV